jgi:hypothetical protein
MNCLLARGTAQTGVGTRIRDGRDGPLCSGEAKEEQSAFGWSYCGTLGVVATALLSKASGDWLHDVGLPGMDQFASAHED